LSSNPEPRFQPGDQVRTIVGIKGDRIVKTEVVARVRMVGWHADRRAWLFYLEGNSRRRHRWYLTEDLEIVTHRDKTQSRISS
jgi:hypothetical protein